MAFDGIMMSLVKNELCRELLSSRVAQIYQPARDELVFSFRTQNGLKKLLIRLSDSPRIHLSSCQIENPAVPPMMCMLLRKRLSGAILRAVTQPQNERILMLSFEAVNEIGDRENLTLAAEIMGRYSNAVLLDSEGRVIDSVRRIDFSMSEDRVLLPKMPYELPRAQDKLCVEEASPAAVAGRIIALGGDDRAALCAVQGISPIIARELIFRAERSGGDFESALIRQIEMLRDVVTSGAGEPTLVFREDGSPMDVSFLSVTQYEGALRTKSFDSFGALLDGFYSERDARLRMRAKSQDISKLLSNTVERLSKKINLQRADLKKCADREELRIKGDLLQANLYRVKKGSPSITVENFYREDNAPVTIRLNPAVTPAQNAQKFYKEYNKAKTREQMLTVQIEKAQDELAYIESVWDALSRAATEAELSQIRLELMDEGYLRVPKGQKRKDKPLPPHAFLSSDGFRILVGRNNRQNDVLTLKTAKKDDIWLHTKNIPGSHTIIVSDGRPVSDTAIEEAARIAAYHSKAKDSAQVPVDFTAVKNVSKPAGAKPGRVIYVKYKTIFVTPSLPNNE